MRDLVYRILPDPVEVPLSPALASILVRRFGQKHIFRMKDAPYFNGLADGGFDEAMRMSSQLQQGDILIKRTGASGL